jgi:hypothetical protein
MAVTTGDTCTVYSKVSVEESEVSRCEKND